MATYLPHVLSTLPAFLTWFPITAAMLVAFGAVYLRLTSWHELALIRNGNTAAAISFAGALLGYAIVLASITASSSARSDLLIWGTIGFVVQILALLGGRLLLSPGLAGRMKAGEAASGIMLGAVSLSAGILNAATMIY